MSRFYAHIQGNRGEASRMGTEKSGMFGHIRGWGIGASVSMGVDGKGEDVCSVEITHGSGGHGNEIFVGKFKKVDGEIVNLSGYPEYPCNKDLLNALKAMYEVFGMEVGCEDMESVKMAREAIKKATGEDI